MKMMCRLLCLAMVTLGSVGFGQSRPGAEEDRINLWPLLYKQGGQLSILGPVFSQSEDNLSVRPLFAVNTADGKRIRILYPLCELNPGSSPNWIGPWWWGDDYRVLFPLWWHLGEPFEPGEKGLSALVPAYCFRRDGENRSLWAPWPLVRNTHWDGKHTWWAAPFCRWRGLDDLPPPHLVGTQRR